jgi:molecular chaperone DnaJ
MAGKKDHYRTLGVPRTTCARGLREAFRELALRHHPDRAGPQGTERFQAIAEAYQVLADPAARARHDQELRSEREPCARERWPERGRSPAEPLFGRPSPRFTLQIPLELAQAGGAVTVHLPGWARCPACRGSFLLCPTCGGSGQVRAAIPLRIAIPPLVADGALLQVELPGQGSTIWLRIAVVL